MTHSFKLDNANHTLRSLVTQTLEDYLSRLQGESLCNVYALVMKEVECALLSTMMQHTDGNQSKAANYLGLARGTLRKKLSEHQITAEEETAA